jgi:hypothetical protein
MSQPLPADHLIFNNIILELNEIVKSGVSEFERHRKLKELETTAQDLVEMSRGYGCSALGSISAARGDVADLRKFHKISIQHSADPALKHNFAISLGKVKLFSEAYEYDRAALQEEPLNVDILGHITLLAFELGIEKEYLEYSRRFQDLTKKEHYTWPLYLAETEEISQVTAACAAATARTMAWLDA